MSLSFGQMSYGGVTLGPSGTAQITKVDGLTGLPDVRNGDQPRPLAQGLMSGYDFLGGRVITLDLQVVAGSGMTMQQNLNALRTAFAITQSISGGPLATPQLAFNFGEQDLSGNGTVRFVVARVRKFDAQVDLPFAVNGGSFATPAVQMIASDPRIYDNTLQSSTVGLIVAAGGLTFPLTFPITFSASTGGLVTASNAGNIDCPPVITITGPVTNPRVQQQTTGQQLQFNLTMANTDVLVLDCYAQTATLNGTVSRMNTLAAGSQWFTIQPGSNTLGFYSSDASATGATMQVQWRNAWT